MTRVLAGALLVLALCSGCVVASPDTDTFRDATATAVEAGLSETATAHEVTRLLDHGDVPHPVAVTLLRDAEEALGAAAASYAALNAPAGQDALQQSVTDVLDDAGDAIHAARAALHRGDDAGVAAEGERLGELADVLRAAQEDVA